MPPVYQGVSLGLIIVLIGCVMVSCAPWLDSLRRFPPHLWDPDDPS